jgi:hypothetical protein
VTPLLQITGVLLMVPAADGISLTLNEYGPGSPPGGTGFPHASMTEVRL